MAQIVIDLYEATDRGDKPLRLVLRHIAYGATVAEAQRVLDAHMKADAFLRAGLTTHDYRGTTVVAMM